MPNNALLQINSFELRNPGEINELMVHALEILNANEKEFREMQNKKWYKRLWEIITFSRNNEKCLARGVTSLAKVQEIVIKMLVMLSRENRQIAALVESNRDAINAAFERLIKLQNDINLVQNDVINLKKILSGMVYFSRPRLSEISAGDREIIMFAAGKYLKISGNTNKDAKEYFSNFRAALKIPDHPHYDKFEFKKISELSDKMSDLLYFNIIADMAFLAEKSPKDPSYKQAIEHVDLSKPKQDLVWQRIKNTEKTEGRDALINGYYEDAPPNFFVDSKDIELIEDDAYYPQVRKIVREYANSIIDAECITPATDSEGLISDFLKDNPDFTIEPRNILAFYDFTNEDNLRTQLLITISGFYRAKKGRESIYIPFDSLTEECRVVALVPIRKRKDTNRNWIDNLMEASWWFYIKKMDKEKFASMLNAIYNLPQNELPNHKADEIYYEIKN